MRVQADMHRVSRAHDLRRESGDGSGWSTKQDFWIDWLEQADEKTVWMPSCLVSGPSTDGGCTKIPPLKVTTGTGTINKVTNNKDKSRLLFETFFPSQGV